MRQSRDNMCKKSKHGFSNEKYFSESCGVQGDVAVRTGAPRVGRGTHLCRMLAPSQDAFVDPKHHSSVWHNPH